MKTCSILALCFVIILKTSCSSNSRGIGNNGAPVGRGVDFPQGNFEDPIEKQFAEWVWLTDKEKVFIKPCKIGQVMVNAQCWDEVHFSPSGVSVSRAGAEFSLFENGSEISEFLSSQYEFESEHKWRNAFVESNGLPKTSFKNLAYERIEKWYGEEVIGKMAMNADDETAPFKLIFESYYGLTPRTIVLSASQEETLIKKSKLASAEFRLILNGIHTDRNKGYIRHAWRMKGTIEVCGQTLRIESATPSKIKEACPEVLVDDRERLTVSVPNGFMKFDFSFWTNSPSDDLPGTVTYDLNFPDPTKATNSPVATNPQDRFTEAMK
jgi:hypothetical protein